MPAESQPHRDDDPTTGGRVNTPEQEPVNPTDTDATNTPGGESVNTTENGPVNGRVLPFTPRPHTATTPAEIPGQDRHEPLSADAVEVLDGELVDDEVPAPSVPVDPDVVKRTWWETIGDATARPLVADWMASKEELASRSKYLVRYAAHSSAFHALRVPKYTMTAFLRSFGALGRLVVRLHRWVYDAESRPVRMAARDRADVAEYMRLREARNETVRKRMLPVYLGIVLTVGIVYVCVTVLPAFVNWTLLLSLMCALGWWGAPADKPVAGRAVDAVKVPRLTSQMVEDALCSLGIGALNSAYTKGRRIAFPSPIARDGDGWRADVDLPLGVVAGDVIAKREELSSALRRQVGCVWPEGDAKVHEGRLVLWVGDKDMSKSRQPAWPLAKAGAVVDLFKPQPFGTDQRGRWVNITLMFVSGVIGAVPRMGKTVTLRELLLIAALDPRSTVYAYDLKGTGDLSALAPCAHGYGVGDDPDDIDVMIAELRELREEMRRRIKVIRSLPDSVCPDNKVTPELAARKDLRLAPVVVGVDECQVWFEHPRYGKEFEEICTDLVKRGPAAGIVLVLATQRPDAKSLPTGISANAILRYCLKVQGHTENDMVLGTSAHKNGVRATMFARTDRGIGYLVGEGEDATIVRSVYQDATDAKKIAAGARRRRELAGNITGHAAGETLDVDDLRLDTLSDALGVFKRGEDKLWSEIIVGRLGEMRPKQYGGWTPANLATALKPHGVKPGQVWATDPVTGKTGNRNGYTRTALTDARNTNTQ